MFAEDIYKSKKRHTTGTVHFTGKSPREYNTTRVNIRIAGNQTRAVLHLNGLNLRRARAPQSEKSHHGTVWIVPSLLLLTLRSIVRV